MTPTEWEQIVSDMTDLEFPPKKTRVKKAVEMTDEEWLTDLENRLCYHGIDVRRELGKMQVWASTKGAKPSRQRFVNWLNKAENRIGTNGIGQTSLKPKDPMQFTPEFDWTKTARSLWNGWDDSLMAGRSWTALDEYYRKEILKRGKVA